MPPPFQTSRVRRAQTVSANPPILIPGFFCVCVSNMEFVCFRDEFIISACSIRWPSATLLWEMVVQRNLIEMSISESTGERKVIYMDNCGIFKIRHTWINRSILNKSHSVLIHSHIRLMCCCIWSDFGKLRADFDTYLLFCDFYTSGVLHIWNIHLKMCQLLLDGPDSNWIFHQNYLLNQ